MKYRRAWRMVKSGLMVIAYVFTFSGLAWAAIGIYEPHWFMFSFLSAFWSVRVESFFSKADGAREERRFWMKFVAVYERWALSHLMVRLGSDPVPQDLKDEYLYLVNREYSMWRN